MGDFVMKEIFTSGTNGVQDAIFLLSQPNANTIAITIGHQTLLLLTTILIATCACVKTNLKFIEASHKYYSGRM